MKTPSFDRPKRSRQNASAVLVLITLVAIMVILATANSKALFHLHREIRFLEKKQVERLGAAQTNANSIAVLPAQLNGNEHRR